MGCVVTLMGAVPSVGIVKSTGDFRVDGSTIRGRLDQVAFEYSTVPADWRTVNPEISGRFNDSNGRYGSHECDDATHEDEANRWSQDSSLLFVRLRLIL